MAASYGGPIRIFATPVINLMDDDTVTFVGGQATVTGSLNSVDPKALPTMMVYQIDQDEPVGFDPPAAPPWQWSITLTDSDCSIDGAPYQLTIYVWDPNGVGTSSVRFTAHLT
jgi:hypothetical protein